jgi:hypothetical protein
MRLQSDSSQLQLRRHRGCSQREKKLVSPMHISSAATPIKPHLWGAGATERLCELIRQWCEKRCAGVCSQYMKWGGVTVLRIVSVNISASCQQLLNSCYVSRALQQVTSPYLM